MWGRGGSAPTGRRITRRSRGFASVTRRRWRSCSARCSGCARTPGWGGWVWSRSTAPRSTRTRRRTRRRDYEQIAREILEEAAEIDALEDEQFGEQRGDQLPPALATREGRQRWLRDARRRLDERRAEEARPVPRSRARRLVE